MNVILFIVSRILYLATLGEEYKVSGAFVLCASSGFWELE